MRAFLVIVLLAWAAPCAAQDRLVEIGTLGDARHPARRVVAWVPREHGTSPLPVLYVHDGQAAFSLFGIDRTLRALIDEGVVTPWVVVAIDTVDLERRRHELAQHAEAYADFVADVVAPAVASRLRVRSDREGTASIGYSYGGLAAVRLALHRPDRFGRAIAMSPSLWWRSRDALARMRRARVVPTRMWIDIGSLEGRRGETVPYMVRDARALRDLAVSRGMTFGRALGYDEAIGEAHDLFAAGRRMRAALAFGLGEIDLSSTTPSALEVVRYPGARRITFAVRAQYPRGLSLTWPPQRAGLRRDVVDARAAIHARIGDLVAHAP
ncbi:alpha/beta hydrolase [Sandaracinus amylolyticus]|uniref:alpha/beta hydrolase n=1 Tax=Sandaracinus amylolyticus TaxID=927083 RepID=UPI001EEF5982|nr:alpha/beta hydrolase-fold protein [Sandaracinus amylolyticus]UJR79109.1 Putative alpha-dextrin endo-1, 6-alpha-glucosidase [Sandaracinus amylolyticus]